MLEWNVLRSSIEDRYHVCVGKGFEGFVPLDLHKHLRSPAWLYIENILSFGDIKIEGPGAVLFDPQIGFLNFFFSFGDDDEGKMLIQVKKALRLRSRLLAGPAFRSSKTNKNESQCEIRICVYWITTHAKAYSAWIESIMSIRNQTSSLEELVVDVIAVEEDQDLQGALNKHGLPRLLLNVRRVLQFSNRDEVYTWRSADTQVMTMLETLPDRFKELDVRDLAADVVRVGKQAAAEKAQERTKAESLSERQKRFLDVLVIENLRNVRNRLQIDLGGTDFKLTNRLTAAHIIHGANGTGKTTIYEALQFVLEGVSERQLKFVKDRDVGRRNAVIQYGRDYLKCIAHNEREPMVRMGGYVCDRFTLDPREDQKPARLGALGDAMMAQDRIKEFIDMSQDELSAIMLKGYSEVAEEIDRYVTNNYTTANIKRQEFLRSLGLRVNITKVETAEDRIIQSVWTDKIPQVDKALLGSIGVVATAEGLHGLAGADEMLSDLEKLVAAAAPPKNAEDALQRETWLRYFDLYNPTVRKLKSWHKDLLEKVKAWNKDWVDDLRLWAEWLGQQREVTESGTYSDNEMKLKEELSSISRLRDQTSKEGQFLKNHLEHVDNVKQFVEERWGLERAGTCPTCETDLTDRGGITNVLLRMTTELEQTRLSLVKKYGKLTDKIRYIQKELAAVTCPVSVDRQVQLRDMVETLAPMSGDLEHVMTHNGALELIVRRAEILMAPLYIPSPEEAPETLANEAIQLLEKRFQKMLSVWHAPTLWHSVNKVLTKEMGSIVAEHLPKTIEALWLEIVFSLTPAPWLIPGRDLRMLPGVGVIVKERLGRYVLNSSEMNISGLAWFLTRYFLEGRWNYGFVVIDDPAQDMDEVAFRDFCRFFYTLLQLHNTLVGEEWSIVFLQHQDDRASTAANILHGYFHSLGIDTDGSPKLEKTLDVTRGLWHIPSIQEAM